MRRIGTAAIVMAALLAAACTEPQQTPGKEYAGKLDEKAYAGDKFKGDKVLWEKTLAARADNMNEYVRNAVRDRAKD